MLELTLTMGGMIFIWFIVSMARNFNEHEKINALMQADGIDPESADYDVRGRYIYLAHGEAPPETPEAETADETDETDVAAKQKSVTAERGDGGGDVAEGVAKLAELHREGLLDDEEFAKAKAKLLS